jgi:hypothetical protein
MCRGSFWRQVVAVVSRRTKVAHPVPARSLTPFGDMAPADRMFLAALAAEADVRMRRAEPSR